MSGLSVNKATEVSSVTSYTLATLLQAQAEELGVPLRLEPYPRRAAVSLFYVFGDGPSVQLVVFGRGGPGEQGAHRWIPSLAPKGSAFPEKVRSLRRAMILLCYAGDRGLPKFFSLYSIEDAEEQGLLLSDNTEKQRERGDDRSVGLSEGSLGQPVPWAGGKGLLPSPAAAIAVSYAAERLRAGDLRLVTGRRDFMSEAAKWASSRRRL
jgi:hypothetical protein